MLPVSWLAVLCKEFSSRARQLCCLAERVLKIPDPSPEVADELMTSAHSLIFMAEDSVSKVCTSGILDESVALCASALVREMMAEQLHSCFSLLGVRLM
mmetsp:Transcript_7573/g.18031  ORF Transcript_7573/g.18031 Transcript_7573/m.18031 type:complete len:99 (+) Transcript_7573:1090-1386(+)